MGQSLSTNNVVEYWFDQSKTDPLPKRVDLRNTFCFPYPAPKDQGSEGACVSYALNTAYVCAQRRKNISPMFAKVPSTMDHFYEARRKSNSNRPTTEGITFSEAMNAMTDDTTWYRLGKELNNFKRCLRSGYPIVVGFVVTKPMRKWQENQSWIENTEFVLPQYHERDKIDGFHTCLFVGYDDEYQTMSMKRQDISPGIFIVRNSWGESWGHDGHFFIPYDTCRKISFLKDAMVIDVSIQK
jgi:hypothetical protein